MKISKCGIIQLNICPKLYKSHLGKKKKKRQQILTDINNRHKEPEGTKVPRQGTCSHKWFEAGDNIKYTRHIPLQGFKWLLPVNHSSIWVHCGHNAPVTQ